jgi:hypothetical protein
MKIRYQGRENLYYFVNPYVFSLSCLGIIGMTLVMLQSIYFISVSDWDYQINLTIVLVLALCIVACLVGFLLDAHELLGIIKFDKTEFIVMAPFRKAFCFPYSEIADIGIDYGYLSTGVQFYIYIGKKKIPQQYCHRINRLPFSKEYARIQYSEAVFALLLERIPGNMKKPFYNSQTVLRCNKQ